MNNPGTPNEPFYIEVPEDWPKNTPDIKIKLSPPEFSWKTPPNPQYRFKMEIPDSYFWDWKVQKWWYLLRRFFYKLVK